MNRLCVATTALRLGEGLHRLMALEARLQRLGLPYKYHAKKYKIKEGTAQATKPAEPSHDCYALGSKMSTSRSAFICVVAAQVT